MPQDEQAVEVGEANRNENETDGEIPLDDVIDAIGKGRKRTLLDVLDEGGGGTFAEVVARVSEEIYGADYSSTERKRVYVSLYQNHVPRLAESGVVVFEGTGEDDRIYQGPAFEETKDALDGLRHSLERSRDGGPGFRTLRDILR